MLCRQLLRCTGWGGHWRVWARGKSGITGGWMRRRDFTHQSPSHVPPASGSDPVVHIHPFEHIHNRTSVPVLRLPGGSPRHRGNFSRDATAFLHAAAADFRPRARLLPHTRTDVAGAAPWQLLSPFAGRHSRGDRRPLRVGDSGADGIRGQCAGQCGAEANAGAGRCNSQQPGGDWVIPRLRACVYPQRGRSCLAHSETLAVRVHVAVDHGTRRVWIRDNCEGMAPDALARLVCNIGARSAQ